ncbi:MAG: PHP domain-containing protein [Clostridia bacterium]|nr:PHP domain-containing protein [Clostridia bacterium]
MIQDLHSHTYYSYCGKDSPEDVIKNAIENGIEKVGISDHYHGIVLASPGISYENGDYKTVLHNKALERYYNHIKKLAERYKDCIEVWCGVEITTLDLGYTLLPDGVDVSMFDYCLIENIQYEETTVADVLEFAARCGCKKTGLAHIDLPLYITQKGLDMDDFFKKMAERNMFWELNVNYDSIHGYKEHKYVSEFFENEKIINAVKRNNLSLSVGFDGHDLKDYDAARVKNACSKLEELNILMID